MKCLLTISLLLGLLVAKPALASKHGISEVHTTKSGLIVDPIVPGIKTAKLHDTNWLSRLAFKQIGKTLREAASTGMEAPATGTDPIAPYILGGAFGEGENGKY